MRLPNFQELSDEQRTVIELPFDKNWVVTGPPGTGKTVLALYRAKELNNRREFFNLVVFSRLLKDYAQSAVDDSRIQVSPNIVMTYHRLIFNYFRNNKLGDPPQNGIHFDWEQMLPIMGRNWSKHPGHLIIDEGQDLPSLFYVASREMYRHVTVFADDRQTIEDGIAHASVQDLKNYISSPRVYEVTKNYRNTLPIALLSEHFFVGESDALPERPSRDGGRPILLSVMDEESSLQQIIDHVSNFADRSVGIFVPRKEIGWKVKDKLEWMTDQNIQTYMRVDGQSPPQVDFEKLDEEGGILITTPSSAKGLEFDSVFIYGTHSDAWEQIYNGAFGKQIFFVMTTRARSHLEFHFEGEFEPSIFSEIPEELLARFEQNVSSSEYDNDDDDLF